MRSRCGTALAALALAALGLAACGSDPSTSAAASKPNGSATGHTTLAPTGAIAYVGREYVFSGPATVAAGSIQVTLQNTGLEYHNLTLARVPDSATVPTDANALADLFFGSTIGKSTAPVVVGGIHAADPGATTSTVIALRPGQYVVACDVADNQANFHYQRGMITTLTVT